MSYFIVIIWPNNTIYCKDSAYCIPTSLYTASKSLILAEIINIEQKLSKIKEK